MPATATEQSYLDALETAHTRYYRAEMALKRAQVLLTHLLNHQPKASDINAVLAEIDRALAKPTATDKAHAAAEAA